MILVLDKSGSMATPINGHRPFDRVFDAARRIVAHRLGENDRLGVVVFDDDAKTICPLTAGADRASIEQTLAQFQSRCTDFGNTYMAPALEKAMAEIREHARDKRGTRIVILTDGHVNDVAETLELVARLERQSIGTLGFGAFDHAFMSKVSTPGGGICVEVGDKDPLQVEESFLAELRVAQMTFATNLTLRVRASDLVKVSNHFIAHPTLTYRGGLQLGAEGVADVVLPPFERNLGLKVVLELAHHPREVGPYEALSFELTYDVPALGLVREREVASFSVTYSKDGDRVNTIDNGVKALHDKCADLLRMVKAKQAAEAGNVSLATELARSIKDPVLQNLTQKAVEDKGGKDAWKGATQRASKKAEAEPGSPKLGGQAAKE